MISTITISFLLIITRASRDALYDEGKKTLTGYLDMLEVLLWFAFIYFQKETIYVMFLRYLSLRIAIFGGIYNLVRGLPLWKYGTTKGYDKGIMWFCEKTKFPPQIVWWTLFLLFSLFAFHNVIK